MRDSGMEPFPLAPTSPHRNLGQMNRPVLALILSLSMPVMAVASWFGGGDSGAMSSDDFERMAMQIRERAIQQTRPPVITAPTASVLGFGKYPWHRNIMTTVFWVGERPTARNPVPNNRSAWDANWARNFGGYDNPDPLRRRNYAPFGLFPRQNTFYCALPYCDIHRGNTKPEVRSIVPWFRECFEKDGKSVLKGRWVAIHHNGRTAFAQWEDCGPFRTDHWQYVFGNGSVRPRPNLNHGAGLDISPSVRDYLGLGKNDYCDWKFVDASSVPDGPWKFYGDNNTFVLLRKGVNLFQHDRNNARRAPSLNSALVRPSTSSVPLPGSSAGVRVNPTFGGQ